MNVSLWTSERETRCAFVLFLGCVRMQRGRSVGGGSSFRALLLSAVLSSSYLTTLLSHQSESRWLSEFWRCRMWNAKHPERSSQHSDSFLSLFYTCSVMSRKVERKAFDLCFHEHINIKMACCWFGCSMLL